MDNVLINILTRTHDRKDYFNNCKKSILNQTYKNINHIVGTDTICDYYDKAIKLKPKQASPKPDFLGSYPAPWNLHIDELHTYVKDGWIMYLDDDDKFKRNDALEIIVNNIENEKQIILWRVDINGTIVPREKKLGKISPGNFSAIGFLFHSKYLPITWGSWNFGDYRAIIQLLNKNLETKWIDMVLTQTQGKPNHGKKPND